MATATATKPPDAAIDQLGRAFAVADDEQRELVTQIGQRRAEGVGPVALVIDERRIARRTGGERQHRVAGRGVAVDRDARKAATIGVGQRTLQKLRLDHGVGEDEAEHRRHVRGDRSTIAWRVRAATAMNVWASDSPG